MIARALKCIFIYVGFFSSVPSFAYSADDFLKILHLTPTGTKIASQLEPLLRSEDLSQRVEVHFENELTVSEQNECEKNPNVSAATIIRKPENKEPTRIIFCRSSGVWKRTLTLAHEAVHAINQTTNPSMIVLDQYVSALLKTFRDQRAGKSRYQLKLEISFIQGVDRLKSFASETAAFQTQYQITQELSERFPELVDDNDPVLTLAPAQFMKDRIKIADLYTPPAMRGDVFYAYSLLETMPWLIEHLHHFIPESHLKEMVNHLQATIEFDQN